MKNNSWHIAVVPPMPNLSDALLTEDSLIVKTYELVSVKEAGARLYDEIMNLRIQEIFEVEDLTKEK